MSQPRLLDFGLVPILRVVVALLILPGAFATPVSAGASLSPESLWLQEYLRIDTSNPPGAEHDAAAFFREILHREGIATRLLVSPTGRPSVYARIEAEDRAAKALVLTHHMDVVPATSGWSREPFGGEVSAGKLIGRGAVDDKSLGIAHLAAFLKVASDPESLVRDVIFLAVADEETGGKQGTAWILEAHPELFENVGAVLGEGGLNRSYAEKLAWWGIEVAQKRPLWLQVTASGRSGHGSMLNLHTAPHRLVRGLGRLLERPLDWRVTPPARRYFEAVAPLESAGFRKIVEHLDEFLAKPEPAEHLLPGLPNYLLDTIQVNVLEAGEKLNMAPATATAKIDIRLLPDTDEAKFLQEVRDLLGPELGVEVLLRAPQVADSPTDTELFRCFERVLSVEARVVPTFIPGITDSRYFRQRDIPAYGLSPFVLEASDLRGIHGSDEQIDLEAFDRGVDRMKRLVQVCAGG